MRKPKIVLISEIWPKVKHYRTAGGMAKAIHRLISERCEAEGLKPQIETFIDSPGRRRFSYSSGSSWDIGWESGPYEWALNLAGSQDFSNELFYLEAVNSFTVAVCKR